MFSIKENTQIYIAKDYVDFRKSIDGLVAIIKHDYNLDVYDQALFIFCNKGKDKLKIIHYQNNGFWLYYKRLDDSRFIWPKIIKTRTISYHQLKTLLNNTKTKSIKP
jgi:hypothetical protein